MISCYLCKKYTRSIEPFVIKRIGERIVVMCTCEQCGFTKARFLSTKEQMLLPFEVNMLPPIITLINKFKYKGDVYVFNEFMGDIANNTEFDF